MWSSTYIYICARVRLVVAVVRLSVPPYIGADSKVVYTSLRMRAVRKCGTRARCAHRAAAPRPFPHRGSREAELNWKSVVALTRETAVRECPGEPEPWRVRACQNPTSTAAHRGREVPGSRHVGTWQCAWRCACYGARMCTRRRGMVLANHAARGARVRGAVKTVRNRATRSTERVGFFLPKSVWQTP